MHPADIANKQFTTTRLKEGYDQGEVDDFLDQVEKEFTSALRRAEAAEQRVAAAVRQTAQFGAVPAQTPAHAAPEIHVPSLDSIKLLLSNAEKTAAELVEKAKADAETDGAKLRVEAAQALQAAKDEAAKLLVEAQAAAAAATAAAQAKSTELEAKLVQLQATYDDVLAKLKAALAAFGEAK